MRTELDALLSTQRFAAGVLPVPWDVRTDLESGDPPERPFALVELAGPAETSGAPVTQDLIIPVVVNLYPVAAASREAATDMALSLRELMWQAVKWGPDARRPTTDRIPLFAYDPRIEQHRFKVPSGTMTFTITVGGHVTAPIATPATATDLALAISEALDAEPSDIVGQDRGTNLWDVFYAGALAGERIGDPAISVGAAKTMLEGAPAPWRGPSDYMRVQSFSQNTVRDDTDPTLVMIAVDLRLTFARGLPLPLDLRVLQAITASADSGPGG